MRYKDKVSIIVPVYNVKTFLERCIHSVTEQTYPNLEIILVDDGSTDGSGKVCDRFAKKDSRIKVIHQKNQGLSGARNAGIEEAKGDFIFFIDSDDWIEQRTIELLIKAIKSNDANIAECSYRCIYNESVFYESKCMGDNYIVDAYGAIKDNLEWKNCKPVAWNKLYRTNIVKDNMFPIGKYHEDEYTTYKYYYKAQKIVFLDIALYNYNCSREDSITAKFSEKNFDTICAFREKVYFIRDHEDLKGLLEAAKNAYYYVFFNSLFNAREHQLPLSTIKDIIHAEKQYQEDTVLNKVGQYYSAYIQLLHSDINKCLDKWGEENASL